MIVQDIRITTLLIFQVSLRISSLDYLGVVAARLRRDAVQSRLKIDTIDAIIETVKEAEDEAGEEVEEDEELEEEEKRTRFLQRVLLDYLAVNGGEVCVLYLCCWCARPVRFRECQSESRLRV